jgi:hypothetical protein
MKDEKPFDAVRMMREIRTQIDAELAGLTFEQQRAYIREKLGSPDRPDRPRAA